MFLEPHTRDLCADWTAKARDTVAYLRKAAGRWPDDPALAGLVGEVTMKSAEFAALWARHPVRDCHSVTVTLRHPFVGEMELAEEVFRAPGAARPTPGRVHRRARLGTRIAFRRQNLGDYEIPSLQLKEGLEPAGRTGFGLHVRG